MRNKYLSYVKSSAVNSELEQTNKFSLQMFYTAKLENVYYSEKSDCFIVADIENNNVYLYSVLYKNYIPLFLKTYTLFLTKPTFNCIIKALKVQYPSAFIRMKKSVIIEFLPKH